MCVQKMLRAVLRFLLLMIVLLSAFCCTATAERLVDTIGAIAPGQLPCIGSPKVLVFCVTFPNGELSAGGHHITLTTEEVESWFFSPALKNSQDSSKAYTEEDSVRSYYYRSSYGKVDITGTVYEYTAQKDASYYTNDSFIWSEIFEYYEDLIDWTTYDTNNDGYLDGAYILARTLPEWNNIDVNNYVVSGEYIVGGLKTNRLCYIRSQELRTFCHETYHMFGLGDMYAGVGLNPAGINTDCIMGGGSSGGGLGDIPGISKYVLGWIDNAHFVSDLGSQTIEISSYSVKGDLIVVYPNGDANNSNWFVIEYVTNQANNLSNGIRIWRTNMCNLDAEHNIVGALETTNSRPVSPMEYIEAISPSDIYNYYYQAGESVTPNSVPSSAYGAEYTRVGGHKYITRFAYSGISIVVDSISGDTAQITVIIEENPAPVVGNASLKVIDTAETGEYIDLIDGFHFATVEADCEMSINGELFIQDANTGLKIPITYILDSKGTRARLLIERENLASVVLDNTYFLPTKSYFTTYAGAEMNFESADCMFVMPNLVLAFAKASETYYLDRSSYGWMANTPVFMRLDSEHICCVDLDTYADELSLIILDTESNTTEKYLLESELSSDYNLPYMAVWPMDATHFGVLIQLTDSSSYLACYDFDGVKIDSLVLDDDVYQYVGKSEGSFLVNQTFYDKEKTRIYEITLASNTLVLNSLDFLYDWIWAGDPIHRQIEYISKRGENAYIVAYANSNSFSDDPDYRQMQIVSPQQAGCYWDAGKASSWVTVGDRFYHIKVTHEGKIELEIHSFDGIIERRITLLESIPADLYVGMDMGVSYEDGLLIVYFNGYSAMYEQSFYSTYLLVFDKSFQVRGYYHSSNTYLDTFTPIYVGDMTFLISGENVYHYISLGRCDTEENSIRMQSRGDSSACLLMKTRGIAATCSEPGFSEGLICAKCSKVIIEAKEIAAIGKNHTWSQGDKVATPTCIDPGCWLSTCVTCGEAQKYIDVAANGHHLQFSHRIEPTCCFDGYVIYNCSNCVYQSEEQLPATGGGIYDTRYTPATCEVEGEFLTYCIQCGYNWERQVFPPTGHNLVETSYEAPTCDKPGVTDGIFCDTCGYIYDAQTLIPPTGHNEAVTPGVEPSCTESGLSEGRYCSSCNAIFAVQMVLPAKGHYWALLTTVLPSETQNGLKVEGCLWCNEQRKEIIRHLNCTALSGDANCNGEMEVYDALLILQSIAGWDVKVCSINADANGDGTVAIDDVLRTLELCFAGDMTKAARALQAMLRNMSISQLQILEQPMNQYSIVGDRAKFEVVATGDGLTYQWYVNRNDGKGWRSISNATQATYTISAATGSCNGWQYRCTIADVYGNEITSDVAILQVEYELPATGDEAQLLLYTVMLVTSGAILVWLCSKKACLQ